MPCAKLLWETNEVILVLRNFLAKKELDSKCEMNKNKEAYTCNKSHGASRLAAAHEKRIMLEVHGRN